MKTLITALLATCLLSACGWQLRGAMNMPLDIDNVYVAAQDTHGTLVHTLTRALESNNVAVSDTASDSQYRILLSNEKQDRRTVSVGTDALASEYELSMSVDYVIQNRVGENLTEQTTASAFRAYDFDRNAVVAKNEEERLILNEMRSNLVQQILRRLRFVSQAPESAPAGAEPEPTAQPAS